MLPKLLKRSHCPDCGRKVIIKRADKNAKRCGVCNTIGVEASKLEYMNLTRKSYNTKFEVKK